MSTNELTVGEIIRRIAEEMASHKGDVNVVEYPLGAGTIVDIEVNQADCPRMVGHQGAHINALKQLATTVGRLHGQTVTVNLLESTKGEAAPKRGKFVVQDLWRREEVESLAKDIFEAVLESDCAAKAHDGDSGTTSLDIYVSPMENESVIAALQVPLLTLFRAIGMTNGRRLNLNIVRE